jgi:histidine triad (HIT) family protein
LFGCEGVTLSLADGAAAGQEVLHAHLHVIPRHANDQFGWKRFGTTADQEQLKQIASRIRSALISPNDRDR